jgi:hypothetical protein
MEMIISKKEAFDMNLKENKDNLAYLNVAFNIKTFLSFFDGQQIFSLEINLM